METPDAYNLLDFVSEMCETSSFPMGCAHIFHVYYRPVLGVDSVPISFRHGVLYLDLWTPEVCLSEYQESVIGGLYILMHLEYIYLIAILLRKQNFDQRPMIFPSFLTQIFIVVSHSFIIVMTFINNYQTLSLYF